MLKMSNASKKTTTVLFISHEASRTGAPLMLLSFLRWFREQAGIPFSVLLKRDGPLRSAFERLCPTYVLYRPESLRVRIAGKLARWAGQTVPWQADPSVLRKIRGSGKMGLIYSNTAVNGDALELLRDLGSPILSHVHELEGTIRSWPVPGCAGPTFTRTNRYVAASDAVRENLVAGHGVVRERVDRVYTAFSMPSDLSRTFADSSVARGELQGLGLAANRRIVVGCGTISERKGTDLFVEMAGRVVRRLGAKAPAFVWVGGGRQAGELDRMRQDIVARGLARDVFCIGLTDEPLKYLVLADVFVMPSREEPFGIVCLEAGALGKPVVCFASAGIAEIMHEDGGIVVPHLDIDAMADAVQRLLEDGPLRVRLGQMLKERVMREHTIDTIGPQIMRAMARCAPEFEELQRWR